MVSMDPDLLRKYEGFFENPLDLLMVEGLSGDQKIAICKIWYERRSTFLYSNYHEGSWDGDSILTDLDICQSILEDISFSNVFDSLQNAPTKIKS